VNRSQIAAHQVTMWFGKRSRRYFHPPPISSSSYCRFLPVYHYIVSRPPMLA
jgi:hypothetical protein